MSKQTVFNDEENDEFDPVMGDESDAPDESLEDLKSRLQTESMWDIFEDFGAKLQSQGDKIKYSIKRNGEYLAMVEHPFSYEKIKQKWGGGTYQVTCRSSKLNKFVKSQTQLIDGTPEEKPEVVEKKENSSMELLTILQTMQKQSRDEQKAELERIREEAKAEREAVKTEGNSQMMLMMKMMETQSQQQQNLMTTLLTVMAGNNKDTGSDKKLDRMFDMMLEMMNNKRSKGEEIDPLQLTKLIQDAEDRGYSRAKELRELAEMEAERLAEIRGSGGKEEKEESTTSQILKSVAPMFAQLAMPNAPIPAAPALPAPVPMVNPHRPAMAAPKIALKNPPPAKVVLRKETPLDKKKIVADVAIKCITDDLSANFLTGTFKPDHAAQKTLDLLARPPVSVDAAWLYANFTLQDMISVAKAKGMPDKINLYLEKFHAYIGAKATVGAGEPASDQGDKPSQ